MSETDALLRRYRILRELHCARFQFQQTNFQVSRMFHEAVNNAIDDYKTKASMLNPFKSGNPDNDEYYSAYKNDDRHEDLLIDLSQDISWIIEHKMGKSDD